MSQRRTDSSDRFFSPYTGGRSDSSNNISGKRSREDLQVDQGETPRKIARLDRDDHDELEESQQPSNPNLRTSDPKQEQEFVDGPGHIVFIDERGKRCPAICFNKGLLSTFNRIAEMSREVRERHQEIQEAQVELEKIKSSNQSAGIEGAKKAVEEAIKIQEDIEAGIPGLVEARKRYDSLAQKNKWLKSSLDNTKEAVHFVIEQILKSENLLKIPTSKPQELVEVDKDHSAKPAPVPETTLHDTRKSRVPESSLASSTTRSESSIDIEDQLTPCQLALRHCRLAAEELEFRNRQFALLKEYAQEAAESRRFQQEQYPDRPASTTQTDFDLTSLQKKQLFIRKVIEAEEAYDRAEQHAEALGLGDILADPHACYWGENYNEFPPRTPESPSMFFGGQPQILESPSMVSVDPSRLRIEAWMALVPDSTAYSRRQKSAEPVEVDDWEAKSVEIFDSVSTFACDMYRKKIDKWQELSGRMREGEAGGPSTGNVRRNPRRRCRGRQFPS